MTKVSMACVTCRRRKVRCDGAEPCYNCRDAEPPIPCQYVESQPSQAGTLKRGTACLSCRARKKKCDGARPVCSTCAAANTSNRCTYADTMGDEALKTNSHALIRKVSPDSSESPELLSKHVTNELSANAAGGSTLALGCPATHEDTSPVIVPSQRGIRTYYNIYNLRQAAYFEAASLRFGSGDFLGSLMFQHQALSVHQPAPEYARVFLRHSVQLGLVIPNFSGPKATAIRSGDLSGQFIHPVLVHISHMWGCVFWQDQEKAIRIDDEIYYFGLARDLLAGIHSNATCPAMSAAELLQANCLLSSYCWWRRNQSWADEYIWEAARIVVELGLHIKNSSTTLPAAISEETLAVCRFMMIEYALHNPTKTYPNLRHMLTQELEALLVSRPNLSSNEVFVLQAASSMLFLKTREHVNKVNSTANIDHSSTWFAELHVLSGQIYKILALINAALLPTSFNLSEKPIEISLKLCAILLLSSAAMLHRHLAILHQHIDSARKCIDIMAEVISISSSFDSQDYDLFDPTVAVCWTEALSVLSQHQRNLVSNNEKLLVDEQVAILHCCQQYLREAMPFLF